MHTYSAFVAIIAVVSCLLCGSSTRAHPSELQQQVVTASEDHVAAIDPSLDSLADNQLDDREKRQLSSVQTRLLNFLKPLPVVDVTKEEEKYGNDGDKFNRIGRGFIGGVETVSSMLTSALSFPVDTAKKLSRSATNMLNNLGGRLVGLQR